MLETTFKRIYLHPKEIEFIKDCLNRLLDDDATRAEMYENNETIMASSLVKTLDDFNIEEDQWQLNF